MLLPLAALVCQASPGDRDRPWLERCVASAPSHRRDLPPLFREVSGLALAPDGRLFLHNDEQGILAAVDAREGRILATYRLGPRTPREDFEGVAIVGDRLFLVTSDGVLFETRVPPAGSADLMVLPFRQIRTGLGARCEVEGLAAEPPSAGDTVLVLACKTPRAPELAGRLTVFRWSVARGALATPERISVPLLALAAGRGRRALFRASGLDRVSATGHYVAVAGPDRAIAEFDAAGEVVAAAPLHRRHGQAEGVVVTADGALIISDEGPRGTRAPGTLTVYDCAR